MAKFIGTSTRDTFIGTAEDDKFITLADSDYIEGGDGNDTIKSGSDADTVIGGAGDDFIDANSDDDYIEGNEGNDTIKAGSGHDTVDAGTGNDKVDAGSGNDCVIYDFAANDGFSNYLNGGSGYDKLVLCVTAQEQAQYGAELDALVAHIQSGSKKPFTTSFGLTVKWFEDVEVQVKGPVNTAPDAVNDVNSLGEDDTTVGGNVLLNDSDAEADPLTVNNPGMYNGTHGKLTLNADGTYSYDIDPADHQDLDDGETRMDTFNVEVTDGTETSTSTLKVTINGSNDAPNSGSNDVTAGDDTNSMTEDDTTVGGNVLTNDTDPEGDPLSVANPGVYVGTHGTLTLNADGTYSYDINPADHQDLDDGESRSDTFAVTVSDGDATDDTELTVTINGLNDAPNSGSNDPTAGDDTNSLTEDDVSVGGNVLTNDTDPEGDPLSVSNAGVYNGTHGTLTLNGDGTYSYAINPADHQDLDDGETRTDTFAVTVSDGDATDDTELTVTINGLNDAPVANDDSAAGNEGAPSISGNVLTNDTDVDGDALNVTNPGVYVGANGTLTLNADGSFDYVPSVGGLAAGDSVSDLFNVTISDGDLGDSSTLEITVNGVNEAPVANDDSNSLGEDDTTVGGNVLTNDSDPDGDAISVANAGVYVGSYGTLTLNGDGTYSYDINPADHQDLDDGETRVDSFNVDIADGSLGDSSTLDITINGENDAPNSGSNDPNAGDDTNSLTEDDASVGGNALTNDTDPDGDTLSVANAGVYVGTHGTLTLNADGSYSYDINPADHQDLDDGDSRSDVFTVTVTDGDATDDTQLTVTINGLNDAPVANDDANAGSEDDAAIIGNVLTNDTDVDGDSLSVANAGVYVGTHGTLTLNADGSYSYAPSVDLPASTSVSDSFNVDITDGDAGDSSTLEITVNGANDQPDAIDDNNSLTEDDTDVAGNVLTNDVDSDGDTLSVSNAGVYVGTHGTLTLNGDGTYSYAINPADHQDLDDGETRVDSFNVDVTDGVLSDSSTLDITINGMNDAPSTTADNNTMTEDDSTVSGNVLTNDSDIDTSDILMIDNPGVYVGTHGTLTLNADGSYDYDIIPANFQSMDDGDSLFDVFNYTATDGDDTSNNTLTIEITGENDAPTAVDDLVNAVVNQQVQTAKVGNVLNNDTDPEQPGNTLTLLSIVDNDGTSHGTLTFDPDGSYLYIISTTPAPGDTVVDSFTYTVEDDGGLTDTGTLQFTIMGEI